MMTAVANAGMKSPEKYRRAGPRGCSPELAR